MAKGVFGVAFIHWSAERQINDFEVVSAFELNSPVNGGNYSAVATVAVSIQHAKVKKVHVRRRTNEVEGAIVTCRTETIAADDACHMFSVTVQILPILVRTVSSSERFAACDRIARSGIDKILYVNKPCAFSIVRAQVLMAVYTAVNHRYPNAGAEHAAVPCSGGVNGYNSVVQRDVVVVPLGAQRMIDRNVGHFRIIRQLLCRCGG